MVLEFSGPCRALHGRVMEVDTTCRVCVSVTFQTSVWRGGGGGGGLVQ